MEHKFVITPSEYKKAEELQASIDVAEENIVALSLPSEKESVDKTFVRAYGRDQNVVQVRFVTDCPKRDPEHSIKVNFEYLKPALLAVAKVQLEELKTEQKKLGIYVK